MKNMSGNFTKVTILLLLVVLSLSGTTARAQAPNSIAYAGLLTDSSGEPREGVFRLTFRIFDNAVGGASLHEQTIPDVAVRKGQFSVLLGPFADAVFMQGSGNRYVEVQVGTDPPLLPRQQLTSAPFALVAVKSLNATRAARVDSIEGAAGGAVTGNLSISGNIGVGTTTPTQRLDVNGYVRGASGLCIGGDCRTSWPTVSAGTVTGSGSPSYVSKWSSATGIANSQIVDNGTNVGIGTTNPSVKLEVVGQIRATDGPAVYRVTARICVTRDITLGTLRTEPTCAVLGCNSTDCDGRGCTCSSCPTSCPNTLVGRLTVP